MSFLLVASIYVNIIPNLTRSASPYAVIENVITHPAYQNQGLGKQLMNDTIHQFYRSCGFDGTAKIGYVAYP